MVFKTDLFTFYSVLLQVDKILHIQEVYLKRNCIVLVALNSLLEIRP